MAAGARSGSLSSISGPSDQERHPKADEHGQKRGEPSAWQHDADPDGRCEAGSERRQEREGESHVEVLERVDVLHGSVEQFA